MPLLFRHDQSWIWIYFHPVSVYRKAVMRWLRFGLTGVILFLFLFLFLCFRDCKKYRWNPRSFPEITSAWDSLGFFGLICTLMKFRSHVGKVTCAVPLPSSHLCTITILFYFFFDFMSGMHILLLHMWLILRNWDILAPNRWKVPHLQWTLSTPTGVR